MTKWSTVALLGVLAVANVVWATITGGGVGPLLGAAAYGVIAVLVLRSRDYRAAFAAGVIGFALHLGRFFRGGAPTDELALVLLIVNTALPLAVLLLALRGWSARKAG